MSARGQQLCDSFAASINVARADGLCDSELAHALAFVAGDFLERNRVPGAILSANTADDERATMASHFGMLVLDAMKYRAKALAEGGA